MPVFNDFNHYSSPYGSSGGYSGSYGSGGYSSHSPSPSTYSFSGSPYARPGLYSPKPTNFPSQYSASNYNPPHSAGPSRYYTGTSGNNYYTYKGIKSPPYNDKSSEPRNTFMPSQYTTYSLWKENQIASKWRNDQYRWNHQFLKDASRQARPIVIDTAKIDFSRQRPPRKVEKLPSPKKSPPKKVSPPKEENDDYPQRPLSREDQVGTIKRGRTVVRMFSRVLKENPYFKKPEEEDKEKVQKNEEIESRINRMSPVRFSRLKKRSSLFRYNRQDSDSNSWLASDKDSGSDSDSDSEGSLDRQNTLKSSDVARSGTVKREETLKKKDDIVRDGTLVRRYNVRTKSRELSDAVDATNRCKDEPQTPISDRRMSMELQAALLDSMIAEEFARKDADNYFSDPKRGTVKIMKSDSTDKLAKRGSDSNTDEEEAVKTIRKKSVKRKTRSSEKGADSESSSERSTPSSSRRNSLFQDLIINETINENFIEELEKKIQNDYSNPEKALPGKKPKAQVGAVKVTQKAVKKSSRLEGKKTGNESKISAIVEVDESHKPKTPKFYIDEVKIESSQFSFDEKEVEAYKAGEISTKNNLTSPEDSKRPVSPAKAKVEASKVDSPDKKQVASFLKTKSPVGVMMSEEIAKVESTSNIKNIPKDLAVEIKSTNTSSPKADSPVTKKADKDSQVKVEDSKKPTSAFVAKKVPILSKAPAAQKEVPLPSKPESPVKKSIFPEVKTISPTKLTSPNKVVQDSPVVVNESEVKTTSSKKLQEKSSTTQPPDTTKKQELTEKESNVLENVTNTSNVEELHKVVKVDGLKSAVTLDNKKSKVSPTETSTEITTVEQGQAQAESNEKVHTGSPKKEDIEDVTPDLPMPTQVLSTDDKVLKLSEVPAPKGGAKKQKEVASDITSKVSKSPPKESQMEEVPATVENVVKKKIPSAKNTAAGKTASPVKKIVKKPKSAVKNPVGSEKTSDKVPSEAPAPKSDGIPVEAEVKKKKKIVSKKASKGEVTKKPLEEKPVEENRSTIVHMKPRAMTLRTVEIPKPSLKSPKTEPLPQPEKAEIKTEPEPAPLAAAAEEKSSSSGESESESDESESSESESSEGQSNQGKHRTSSLDSGFGSCSKNMKGIALRLAILLTLVVHAALSFGFLQSTNLRAEWLRIGADWFV